MTDICILSSCLRHLPPPGRRITVRRPSRRESSLRIDRVCPLEGPYDIKQTARGRSSQFSTRPFLTLQSSVPTTGLPWVTGTSPRHHFFLLHSVSQSRCIVHRRFEITVYVSMHARIVLISFTLSPARLLDVLALEELLALLFCTSTTPLYYFLSLRLF